MRTYRLLLVTLVPETAGKKKRSLFQKTFQFFNPWSHCSAVSYLPTYFSSVFGPTYPFRFERQQLLQSSLCCSQFSFWLGNSNHIARFRGKRVHRTRKSCIQLLDNWTWLHRTNWFLLPWLTYLMFNMEIGHYYS